MFMDQSIRHQLRTFTLMFLCGADRQKFLVDPHFERAFEAMTLQERIELYHHMVTFAVDTQRRESVSSSRIDIEVDEEKES